MTKNNGTSATAEATISLRRLERVTYEIKVQGKTPLIANRWSEKAKAQMLAAQQTTARTKKEPKDPVALYEAARYRFDDGRDGFPAVAFKAAIVGAARKFEGITMTSLKQALMVVGEGPDQLVPLEYSALRMREDAVRNASGVADLRYRPQYDDWSATLQVVTIKGEFDLDSLFALVDAAGFGGVGEWRPSAPKSATGTYGMFEVVDL